MISKSSIFAIVLAIILEFSNCLTLQDLTLTLAKIPEDGRLQFCQLANKYKYECTGYNVTTEDGYILCLYNIPGDKSRPVYLQHGLFDSSDTFLVRTNKSLVAFLADEGYDVWLGNTRGNKYSRAHMFLNPEGFEFWEFSFHEMALYDIPAMVDFVLEKTKQNQLQVIAHSQGTSVMIALGTLRPEYNDKIKVLICMSPIVYLHHAEPLLLLGGLGLSPILSSTLALIGHGELLRNSSELLALVRVICTQKLVGYKLCVEGLAFPFFGRDSQQFEPEFLPVFIGHFPSGTSKKNLVHLLQITARKEFAQYDYGLQKNQLYYKNYKPPVYELNKVTMKTVLIIGLSDKVNNIKDVFRVRCELPNVVDYHVMERKEWNHIDFIVGKDMDIYLFPYILSVLEKYNK